jgi:hypothetical protein
VVTGGPNLEDPGPAPAGPAPLTQEQIHALARGVADEAEIARLLEAHSPPERAEPARRSRKRPPVRVSADELATLRERGRTPTTVAEKLKEAARKDVSTGVEPAHKEVPTERPPGAPGRR